MSSTPTVHFRWLVKRRLVTSQMIIDERDRTCEPIKEITQRLEQRTAPVLQQMHETGHGAQWIDVPVFVEYID